MQRWQLYIALILTSVMSAPAAGAAGSSDDGPPTIASGILLDAADRPVAGDVELLAWPTGRPVQIGETVKLVPVGYVRAGKDGRFAVRTDASPELAELATLNGGFVNLELRALSGGDLRETQFSRYLADTRFSAHEASAGKAGHQVDWQAGPDEPAEPMRVNVGATHSTDTNSLDAIHPMQGGCTGLKLIDKQIADTVIGELRTPPDTLSATFIYGKRADSEISVAARGARGPWELSGSHHIANAQGAAIRQSASGAEHLIVRTRFRYDKYETVCPSGRRERVVPGEWMGDVMATPTPQIGCLRAPEDRLGRYGPRSGFERDRERAVQWAGAVDVFGVGLAARSGYSTQVHADWTFGTDGLHLLCGDDAAPWKSKHIYAGFSA